MKVGRAPATRHTVRRDHPGSNPNLAGVDPHRCGVHAAERWSALAGRRLTGPRSGVL